MRSLLGLSALFLSTTLACGGDSSGPGDDPDPTPVAVDAAASTFTATGTTLAGDGNATVQLVVQPRDANGAPLQRSGLAVAFVREGTTPGTLSAVTYDATSGAYRATLTAPQRMEPLTTIEGAFTATIGGAPVRGGSANATRAVLTFGTIPNPVIVASQATAAQLGATVITGAVGEQVFHLAAAVGDSWKLKLAPNGTNFTLEALHSEVGLTSATGTLTRTTTADGVRTTLRSAAGSGATITIEVDNRTKAVAGDVAWGAVTTSVAGTGYKVTALAPLAGEYVYASFTQGAAGGARTTIGTMTIGAGGTLTLCEAGALQNDGTTCIDFRSGAVSSALTGFTASTTLDGLIRVQRNGNTFAYIIVQPGDRGPVLNFDRVGPDPLAPTEQRRGIAFATPRAALAGNEGNGQWECSIAGVRQVRFDNSGTVARGTNLLPGGTQWTDQLQYNRVSTGPTTQAILNGTINLFSPDTPPTNHHILPLSASMIIAGGDELPPGVPAICPRTA